MSPHAFFKGKLADLQLRELESSAPVPPIPDLEWPPEPLYPRAPMPARLRDHRAQEEFELGRVGR